MHFLYEESTGKFLGLNTFGIRLRHEVINDQLNHERSIDYVISHLADANFDPEFYTLHEPEIVAAFNSQTKYKVQLKKKSWKRILRLSK
jgi:hypothetical protein